MSAYQFERRRMLPRVRVGAGVDPSCSPPASVDPQIAVIARDVLTLFMQRGAKYGAIDYRTIGGKRYAFRYSEHPPDAGIASPHPGVDYLICSDPSAGAVAATDSGNTIGMKAGLPALAIAVLGILILASK